MNKNNNTIPMNNKSALYYVMLELKNKNYIGKDLNGKWYYSPTIICSSEKEK